MGSWHVNFMRTTASWLNRVERWYAELTGKQLQRGEHRSVTELNADIMSLIDAYDKIRKRLQVGDVRQRVLSAVRRSCLNANELRETKMFDTNLRYRRSVRGGSGEVAGARMATVALNEGRLLSFAECRRLTAADAEATT